MDRSQLAASNAGEEIRTRNAAPPSTSQVLPTNTKINTNAGTGLAQHWELGAENKRGSFTFRPHLPNYVLLANYSFASNPAPFSPLAGLVPEDRGLSHTEVKFQLGFKMKLMEDVSPAHADLWLGYTHQSYWQAYNRKASSPFRETDYQPELMAVMPVDFNVFGMQARFVNFGLVHQSNDRGSTLSRSWN